MAFSALLLNHFIENGLYWPLSAFIENCLYQEMFALLLYRKGLLLRIFVLSLHQKRPLSRIFCFIAISKKAFIKDFLLYCFIKNSLYLPLSAFIKNSLFCFIENTLFGLSQKRLLSRIFRFIEDGLYWEFFALLLYRKWPLWRIFHFIALSKMPFIENSLFCFIALSF